MLCATLLILQSSIPFLSGEEPQGTPGAAKLLLDVRRAEAEKPLHDLQEKFAAALDRLRQGKQEEGDLDALLVLKKEKEEFRDRKGAPEPSTISELNSLREIYFRELVPLKETQAAAERKAFLEYKANLEAIVADLTRKGDLEAAIKLRQSIETLEIPSPATADEPAEEIVVGEEENYTTTPELTVTKDGKYYVLSSAAKDGEKLLSKRVFKTPFTLQARAMTNKNNIRLYFGQQGMIVFNWEMKRSELRIIEPVIIKRNGIPDFRPLDSERMYDLEVRVTDSNISVYANKRKQGEVDGDFSKAEGPIGIGPARGSVVTVERLVGIQQ